MGKDASVIFKPDAVHLLKIFRDSDSFYQIPDYQRPYSWRDEEIDQLWDDLLTAFESGSETYFLGPIILIQPKDKYFEVVDGQQRLTTLTIMLCVIRDLYGEVIAQIDKRLINSISDAIQEKVGEVFRLRVITQFHHQNQFEQEILNQVKFPKDKLTKKEKENRKFINCALIFKNRLEKLEMDRGIKGIIDFVNFLFNRVELIRIICSKHEYAINLFQILNTRGLDLSNADLIKSHLYGKLNEHKRKQFMATWQDIELLSKQMDETITDLLTYYEYYLLARNPKKNLFEELKNALKNRDPNEIIFEFKQFIESFYEIYTNESKLLFSFWYLRDKIFWKSILITAKFTKYSEFDELAYELRRLYYCYWIAGYTIAKIKQLSFNLIEDIKRSRTFKKIKERIDQKMKEHNVIEYARFNIYQDAANKSWIKPLLILVEYHQTDDSKLVFIELDRNLHLEHILPVKWEENPYWKKQWKIKPNAYNKLNNLGNVTLLSGRKNISAKHYSFPKKKEIYKGKNGDSRTSFLITQRIAQKKDWTEIEVYERQKWLEEQIFDILRIPRPTS
ncbi:MAG: DUF262 domain-containing protein [Candidatus Helarchaeota archaeon]